MHLGLRLVAILAGILLLGLTGCSGDGVVSVEGVVKLDGQPLGGATVVFTPVDEKGQSASGLTKSDGTFGLTAANGKKGAAPGVYKVVVSHSEVMAAPGGGTPDPARMNDIMREARKKAVKEAKSKKDIVPAKYSNAQTTPFQETVPPKGKIILELSSK
jgi:hypothetical protein